MQELVKEMYPDDNREELREHIYKVIRRLPKEAMYETAVKWGIIDKKGNKVICKDIFCFLSVLECLLKENPFLVVMKKLRSAKVFMFRFTKGYWTCFLGEYRTRLSIQRIILGTTRSRRPYFVCQFRNSKIF